MTPYIIQQQCSWNTLPGNRAVTDSSAQRKMLTFRKMHSASKLIVSPLECKSLQTCYATPPASSPFIWLPLSSITCLLLHIPASDLCKPSAPPPLAHKPLPILPSHQGLKSMTMFLLELWVVVDSLFVELHVTASPYRPHTAVAGELTDSLTVVPSCSTILASQHSSSSWSTIGMMTWVPLDTMGRGPATQVIVESCYKNTVTKVSGTRYWCIEGDISCFFVIFPFPSVCSLFM